LGRSDRLRIGILRIVCLRVVARSRDRSPARHRRADCGGTVQLLANLARRGAIGGDWLAYWLALFFKDRVLQTWPLANHPDLVARSVAFFNKWGMLAVFVGRFFGPFRAVVPLIAGVNAMPWLNFQIANVASAALWAAGILLPGFIGVRWLMD
jgi:membrane protein DedA with SNARE-associated domain